MADMTELNRVVQHCADNPEQHNQGNWINVPEDGWADIDEGVLNKDWHRHVVACIAGWTAILHGWRPADRFGFKLVHPTAGLTGGANIVAREILGLDPVQAAELFTHSFTMQEIRAVVEKIGAEQEANR